MAEAGLSSARNFFEPAQIQANIASASSSAHGKRSAVHDTGAENAVISKKARVEDAEDEESHVEAASDEPDKDLSHGGQGDDGAEQEANIPSSDSGLELNNEQELVNESGSGQEEDEENSDDEYDEPHASMENLHEPYWWQVMSNTLMVKDEVTSLRDRALLLLAQSCAIPGQSARGLRLVDFQLPFMDYLDHPEPGILHVLVNSGGLDDEGNVTMLGIMRHRDIKLCPVAALAVYWFQRFMMERDPLPGASSDRPHFPSFHSKQWYDFKAFVKHSEGQPLPADNAEIEVTRRAHRIAMEKLYNSVALEPEEARALVHSQLPALRATISRNRVYRQGEIEWDCLATASAKELSMPDMRVKAGFDVELRQDDFVPRMHIDVPESLEKLIFPEADQFLEKVRYGQDGNLEDSGAEGFLRTLIYLRKVLLQDSVGLLDLYPHLNIWKHSPFNTQAYRDWSRQLYQAISKFEANPPPSIPLNEEDFVQDELDLFTAISEMYNKHHLNAVARMVSTHDETQQDLQSQLWLARQQIAFLERELAAANKHSTAIIQQLSSQAITMAESYTEAMARVTSHPIMTTVQSQPMHSANTSQASRHGVPGTEARPSDHMRACVPYGVQSYPWPTYPAHPYYYTMGSQAQTSRAASTSQPTHTSHTSHTGSHVPAAASVPRLSRWLSTATDVWKEYDVGLDRGAPTFGKGPAFKNIYTSAYRFAANDGAEKKLWQRRHRVILKIKEIAEERNQDPLQIAREMDQWIEGKSFTKLSDAIKDGTYVHPSA